MIFRTMGPKVFLACLNRMKIGIRLILQIKQISLFFVGNYTHDYYTLYF